MTGIHELVKHKLKQRELLREQQKQQDAESLFLLKKQINDVARALQCDDVVVMREDVYDNENYVAAKLIYEHDDVSVAITCVVTYRKSDRKITTFVFVCEPPVKVSLSDTALVNYLIDKIAEKIVDAKEEQSNRCKFV